MNMKTLKWVAVVLLMVIVLGAGIYWMVTGMSRGGLEGFQTATPTTQVTSNVTMKSYIIAYEYQLDTNNNIIACYVTKITDAKSRNLYTATIPYKFNKDIIALLKENTDYIKVSSSELIWMKFANSNTRAEDDIYYVSHPGRDTTQINPSNPTYILPSHIICKQLSVLDGKQVYLFNKSLFTNITFDKATYKAKENGTPIDINLYTSPDGLLRSMATNDSIEETVFKYHNYGPDKYKCFGFGTNETSYKLTKKPYNINELAINPYFNEFSSRINILYTVNPSISLSTLFVNAPNISSKLTELDTADANLNSLLTEGFQTTTLVKIAKIKDIQNKLENNKSRLETEKSSLISNKAALESEKTSLLSNKSSLQSNKSRLETENTALLSKKTELENQIKSAEAQLVTINQTIQTALATKSGFQDVTAASPSLTLTDDLAKLTQQITELTNEKTNAESVIAGLKGELATVSGNLAVNETARNKLTTLETVLKEAGINNESDLASKLKSIKPMQEELEYLRTNKNCPPVPVCPPAPNCPPAPVCPPTPDIMAIQQPLIDKNNRDLAKITELENKIKFNDELLQAADEKYRKLEELLNKQTTALTENERVTLTKDKIDAEETLKLTQIERDGFMRQRDELTRKQSACEQSKLNMPGPGMGSRPPEYVCRPTYGVGAAASPSSQWAMPVPGVFAPDEPVTYRSREEDLMNAHPELRKRLMGSPAEYRADAVAPGPDVAAPGPENQQPAIGIPDAGLAPVSFTNIPKIQPPYTWENPYWTYRQENYDSQDRYALATPAWWVTGHNA